MGQRAPLFSIAGVANANIVTPGGPTTFAAVRFAEEAIAAIEPGGRSDSPGWIDANGLIAIPGLIDLQTNGAFGFDCASGDPADLIRLSERLPETGCTAYFPTVVTASVSQLESAVSAIADVAESASHAGAAILGIHLEGPWIGTGQNARGAHNLEQIRPFSASEWDRLHRAARGTIRLVTLAPEPPGHLDAIRALAASDAVVSLGHTDATYEQLIAGVDAGATLATHAFNAMRGLGHREPGAAGGVLTDDRIVTTVIPDGVHVHPAALDLLVRAKGVQRVVGVTDSIWCAGLPNGTYPWGGSEVSCDGIVARRSDGRLAGSTLTTDQALRNLMRYCNLRLSDAAMMLSASPARVLGQMDRGVIEPGRRADLVLLDDSMRVEMTLIGGRIAYANPRRWAQNEVQNRQ